MLDDLGTAAEAPRYGTVPQYPIDSVDNALKVLLLLAQRPSLRITEVSHYLGVASSSAHRLLATLQFRGFVAQDPDTRQYAAGPALDDLAFGALARVDIRSRARPVLARLNAELEETVHLGRLEGAEVHFIAAIESTRALRVGSRLGRFMPAHCTSTGKALLSTLPDSDVRALYPHERLAPLTRHSITTRTALRQALAEVRRRGYAVSREESEEGVGSMSVPIGGDAHGRLALNASVPRSRLTTAHQRAIRDALVTAAAEIRTRLL